MSMPKYSTESGSGGSLQISIKPHALQIVPWSQIHRQGNRADRMTTEVTVNLPPKLDDYSPDVPAPLAANADQALTAMTHLDSAHGLSLDPLSSLLLRAESVASSKIEYLQASIDDFARASHGIKSNESATSMVASSKALDALVRTVDEEQEITLQSILDAHRILMQDDPSEAQYAGRLRDMQNWIGGSDYSPRNARYVPPPANTVTDYMEDLLEFANRDDIPALVQAAVAHAQFESIHPFTDGNGRIGRALINAVLRRRGVTSRIVLPVASSLIARRETYFGVLNAYRGGDAGPIVRAIAQAARVSASESEHSAELLSRFPQAWVDAYTESTGRPPRASSAALKILDRLPSMPFFTAEEMEDAIVGSTSSVYSAIETLNQASILRPLTNRVRGQIWCATSIIEELEDLGERIAAATLNDPVWDEVQISVLSDRTN